MGKVDGSDEKVIASTSKVEDEVSWNKIWEDWNEFCEERPQGPFFFGSLSEGTDQYGHKYLALADVKSAKGYHSEDLVLRWRRRPRSVQAGEWVIGIMANEGPIVFFNDAKKYPVQVLKWSDFRESDGEQSLEKYLRQYKAGELAAKDSFDPSIIGNEKVPGHLIITDGVIYVKGFFSYGKGVVKYSEVFKYDGDFLHEVAERNQAMEMDHFGTDSIILLPPKLSPVDRHSVMDCEGWVPLSESNESEESKPRDVSKGEDMKTDSSASGQLTNIETKNIVGAQVGEEMADVGGVSGLKSDQNEVEESNSHPVSTQKINDDVHDMASTSAGKTIDDKDNPTYSFGPNVGGAIVAATQALKNEQDRTEGIKMHPDTSQKNAGETKVQPVAEAASGTGKVETEESFLKRFIESVKQCGFYYAEQDLIRFHTCVKCGFLTVLGGAPGAGKSSLVKLYASAILGRKDGKCRDGMLMVDVNSSWAEPSDVLGYWDLEKHYRPSTGVVPFLRKAIKSEHLNIVCLEEMNLARVEHYFSDFMQLSEREIAERELKGVPLEPNSIWMPESENQEEARLPIGKSVRIVGTNNFDQTTQRFSARFFDRCNYIELQDSRMNEDFLFSRPNIDQGNFNCTVSWDTYESWKKISPKVKMEKRDKGFVIKDENGKEIFGEGIGERFKKIWVALKNLNLKPSPRVESSLVEYIVNRPFIAGYETECKNDYERQLRVLDEFVAQRILPRYTPSYLIDDSVERDALETALKDMTLSLNILNEKKSELDGKPHA